MSVLEDPDRDLSPASEAHWIPLSDLMTGLMMIFLLISILYMLQVEDQRQQVTDIAVVYSSLRTDLYQDLYQEFRGDLDKWGAEISRQDLVVRFKEPDVLFSLGSSELQPRFRLILSDFFPRYVAILTSPKYRNSISEVRIEGHTSSIWRHGTSVDEAYFNNMQLSQSRTRSTLSFVMSLAPVTDAIPWLRTHVTANGLSFAKLVRNNDGSEDPQRSQRVEFRVVTNAEQKMSEILEIAR